MTNEPSPGAIALRCPKCEAPMRTYERNGVNIDRCTECGGLFLHRGELERLFDAEAGYYAGPPSASPPPSLDRRPREPWRGHRRYGDDDDDADRRRGGRGGFLDDLLDFG